MHTHLSPTLCSEVRLSRGSSPFMLDRGEADGMDGPPFSQGRTFYI